VLACRHGPSRPRGARALLVAAAVALASLVLPAAPGGAAGASFFGSLGAAPLNAPVVALDATPRGDGYLVAASDGGVFTFGAAHFAGSLGGTPLNAPIVDVAATPDGRGYLLAASDGGVFTFGSATFAGSLGSLVLNQPIGGIALHRSGRGYWLWAADGGIFAFGAARFHGSLAGLPLGSPVVGMAAASDGAGYWLATADGRVAAFGTARHHGDARGLVLGGPIADLAAASDGQGYALLGADGGVLTFGSARFHGSAAGGRFVRPMLDLEYTPLGDGYWLLAADGGIFTYPGTVLPPGGTPRLSVTTVVAGLAVPWDLGFLPDGTILFTERPGRLSALVAGRVRLLAAPADVRAVGEGGMTGLAIDPAFARNRFVYTCMNTTAGDVKVVKWRVPAALDRAERVGNLVVGLPAIATGRHSGCRPRFGPDGHLWIGTGDAATGTNPQDLRSLGGKVLRVETTFGTGVPGNLTGRILTYGHRNVQGLAFRPGSGSAYSVEHGPDRDDEINVLVPGGNYGWDPVPGYNETVPMTDLRKFPAAVRAAWSSGFPTIAPSGATFLTGPQWRDWDGTLAVATLKNATLLLFSFDPGDRLTGQQVVLSGYGRLRTPVQGPDGSLYVTTSNGTNDRILRVTPLAPG
jgi:glucose/arabinose dehydrogenase